MMAVSSFLNSRIVKRFGMRRLSHFALIVYISGSILLVAFSLAGFMPLWLFFSLLMIVQFVFGWAASNMNSLSMEPLGAVAGTAASVFGFIQTVGGALLDDRPCSSTARRRRSRSATSSWARSRLAACSSPRTAGCSASARSTPEAARLPRGSCGCPAGP